MVGAELSSGGYEFYFSYNMRNKGSFPSPNSNLIYSEPTSWQANGKFNLSCNWGSFPPLSVLLELEESWNLNKYRILDGHTLVFSLGEHVCFACPHSPLRLSCSCASWRVW